MMVLRANREILSITVSVGLLLLSIAGFSCSSKDPEPKLTPGRIEEIAATLEHGIDVSCHAGEVNWDTIVSQGYSFAFVKATEGDDLKDSLFDDHWANLKRCGITRGAYHFYVTEDDPDEQARFFIETVALEPGDLAPVVDIELIGHGTTEGLSERFRTFLTRLEKHYGIKPIIYTSCNFWNAHLSDSFGDYPLWLAEYEVTSPRLPAGWQTWHLWQWKENADLVGVEKGADLSRVNRSLSELTQLVVKTDPVVTNQER
jgi:lysozyme